MNTKFSILEARKELQKELGCNFHAVPAIQKIVVSTCCSRFLNDTKKMEQIKTQLTNITGQRPIETKARKSVASFKIREGMHLGYMVTMRGKAAERFLFNLIYITLPRVTDFRGLSSKSFDGNGNYNIGLREVGVFMQASHDMETKFGMNITFVTSSPDDSKALKLLQRIKVPFKDLRDKKAA